MFKSILLASALLASNAALAATDAELGAGGKLAGHAIKLPTALKKPTAYGAIYLDGTVQSGSGNFSAVWNGSAGWYEITISGVNYYYLSHATTITASVPVVKYTSILCSMCARVSSGERISTTTFGDINGASSSSSVAAPIRSYER